MRDLLLIVGAWVAACLIVAYAVHGTGHRRTRPGADELIADGLAEIDADRRREETR